MKSCGQLCPWNTLYGCQKPENEPCILSNMPCKRFEQKPQTNADHIRSMTDEELAEFLHDAMLPHAYWLDWLKLPYKEET